MLQGSLSGIRVLDLSRLLPGPFCSMILADLGAEVIKVESPLLGDPMRLIPPLIGGQSCYFLGSNRNKKSLALNVRRQEGREVFFKLVRSADVVIESYQPGRADDLGIGYQDLRALKPGLVYCSLSSFGQDGPFAGRPGHDLSYAALAGLVDLLGLGETVLVPGLPLADLSGALFAAIGILSALIARDQLGTGTYVDTSIFHSVLSMMSFSAAIQMSAQTPSEGGQRYLMGTYPFYRLYRTKDGRHMALAAVEPVLWADFCEAVGREDWIRKQHPTEGEPDAVIAELDDLFIQRTQAEWIEFFRDKPVCCEPVYTLQEALLTPPVQHRGLVEMEHPAAGPLKQIGLPFDASGSSHNTASPPPLLGQHTVEILQSLGYDDKEIGRLRERRVVSTPDEVAARRRRNGRIFGRSTVAH